MAVLAGSGESPGPIRPRARGCTSARLPHRLAGIGLHDHNDFGSNRSKIMHVIDFKSLERDHR
jgi:hypothetical protein